MTTFRGFNVGLLCIYLFFTASNSYVKGAWAGAPIPPRRSNLFPEQKKIASEDIRTSIASYLLLG